MKKYLIIIGISALFACNSNKSKHTPLEDSLANANTSMSTELKDKEALISTKEEAMNEFVKSFNDIEANLNEIKAKEKIISKNSKGVELKKSDKDQIIGDIQMIYDLLNKNKQKVAVLSKKLKDSNLKMDDLQTAVTTLTDELNDKEFEITDLKTKLENLNVDFANLKVKYGEEREESNLKTEKLNTAYYAVGEAKELSRKGVVTKEGGFIGIGKVEELNKAIDENNFTKINILETTEIPVSGKRVKLVTIHPEGSYKLIEAGGVTSKLVIIDPEKFWSASKYLIVTAEK